MELNQVTSGLGGSDLVFGLTPAAQLNASDVFTVGATFANAQGGADAIQAVRLSSAVPEPASWAMMILGFASIGFMA